MGPLTAITYPYGKNLYVNLTNQCPCACEFCVRKNSSGSLYADNLWYEGDEPRKEEILADILSKDLSAYEQLVFCVYGEPACRWDDMLWLCREVRRAFPITLRLNTNGLSDLINGRSTAPELDGLMDIVSISLNAPTAEQYDALCHPSFGLAAFDAMLKFTANAVLCVPHVVMTVVDTMPQQDIRACERLCRSLGAEFRVREYIEN